MVDLLLIYHGFPSCGTCRERYRDDSPDRRSPAAPLLVTGLISEGVFRASNDDALHSAYGRLQGLVRPSGASRASRRAIGSWPSGSGLGALGGAVLAQTSSQELTLGLVTGQVQRPAISLGRLFWLPQLSQQVRLHGRQVLDVRQSAVSFESFDLFERLSWSGHHRQRGPPGSRAHHR